MTTTSTQDMVSAIRASLLSDSKFVIFCYNRGIENQKTTASNSGFNYAERTSFRMNTPDYITIPLSKTGKYAGMYEALISPEDADLAELNWTVYITEWTIYAYRKTLLKNGGKTLRLHRAIMECMLGRELKKGEIVDHINGNGLDNRRENLRLATPTQNNANMRRTKINTSGYKGVSWNKEKSKWHARIWVNGVQKHLGYFDTPQKAHSAYCDAADKYFGEFANYGSDDNE